MATQEDQPKRKGFQKKTDDDIESFLSKSEASRTESPPKATAPQAAPKPATPAPASEAQKRPETEEMHETTIDEHEEQIRAARSSRAEAEAYHDVAVLRKKAHACGHKAAKFYHKYRANEAKAQKCQARAVAHREKAGTYREKARNLRDKEKEYESELSSAAQGKVDLSPESIRTRMAAVERKAAKQDELARRSESRAAAQTAKSAKFRTRAAKYLEQNKLQESEAKRYAKRADNLEKAGV